MPTKTAYDSSLLIVDSMPVPAYHFARTLTCQRFKGEVAYGKDTRAHQTFHGFRFHLRLIWPGLITCFTQAPANVNEIKVMPGLTEGTLGLVIGDRNYWAPNFTTELNQEGFNLQAPFKKAGHDPWPSRG